jgi:predicted phosphodiesterase
MRLAVLSDIHGNLESLHAVLEDMHIQGPDKVICLGDVVGYGPNPEETVALLRQEGILSVQGNHEQGILFPDKRDWFNPTTRRSLEITAALLSLETINFLRTWPTALQEQDFLAVHGCPPADAFTYLFEYAEQDLPTLFQKFSQPLCFVGHTHMLQLAGWDRCQAWLNDMHAGRVLLDPACRYIINVGSVGQPRDGTISAKYVIWDSCASSLDVRAVPYDAKPTIAKIEALGFPEINARRLRG